MVNKTMYHKSGRTEVNTKANKSYDLQLTDKEIERILQYTKDCNRFDDLRIRHIGKDIIFSFEGIEGIDTNRYDAIYDLIVKVENAGYSLVNGTYEYIY